MKAAVLTQIPGELEIEDVGVDKPAANEVLVQVVASGLCHSDLHFMEGLWQTRLPAVMGHEGAGIVEAVGSDVTYVKPGDHVITCLSVFCGQVPLVPLRPPVAVRQPRRRRAGQGGGRPG